MRRALLSLLLVVAVAGPGAARIPSAAAAEATVTLGDRAEPAQLTVAPGSTVTFANQSDDRRRVRSKDGPEEFDSGNLDPGASWSVTLEAAGTYAYVDDRDRDDTAYHGTITVGALPAAGAPAAPAGSAAPPAPAAPEAASVTILDRSYAPATVTVAAGGTVSWTNQSDRDHTVTGTGFDSGGLGGGGRFSHTFPSAGTFAYVCDFHPEMRASVVVTSGAGVGPPPAPPPGPAPAAAGRARVIPAAPPAPAAPPEGDGAPATAEVSVVDFAFGPAAVRLAAGGTVTWRLDGRAPHTVSGAGGSFDSGLLRPGTTFRHRFDAAGTYRYVCAFHPEMTGTVDVVDAASPAGGGSEVGGDPAGTGGNGEAGGGTGGSGETADTGGAAADDGAGGEPAAAQLTGDGRPASGRWGSVLAALLAVAALLAGTGALLYGGSRMMAADDGRN